jgi:DNA-binding response OmpR family regulator
VYTVCIVSPVPDPSPKLVSCVEQEGISWFTDGSEALGMAGAPDAALLDMTSAGVPVEELVRRGRGVGVPLVAALSWELLPDPPIGDVDDFVVCPWHAGELAARLRELQQQRPQSPDAPGLIRVGDLTIDPDRYEVFLAGKPVLLTFKEYELLKLLAKNPGRVFKREHLLNQVWEYDYFGGTRTVDVHIRRLRSKIEDATHTFIETVWNVGYRLKG